MKMKKVLTILAASAVLTGCATSSGTPPLLHANITTNAPAPIVQTVAVSTPMVEDTTNVATGVVTVATNWQTNLVIQTNLVTTMTTQYVVAPALQTALSAANTVATITGPVNPFSGWVTLGLTALSGALGWYATAKTKQAATNAGVASTVISAVEGLAPAVAPAIKAAVTTEANKQGTAAAVYAAVQAVTANAGS
ncbi:MAG: hypothetical protein ABSA83_09305 [Verrucomicrobiota bacterium]|jgi:hypothetical protein